MVELSDKPISEMDLDREFEDTGLPKGALASMLRFDRALVTRLLEGRRAWKPGEAITARAFFALVPQGIDERFRDAVRQLTRSNTLARVMEVLTDDPRSPRMLGGQKDAIGLRADHVVHMCRIAKIDLPELVARDRVVTENSRLRLALFDPAVDQMYARAAAGEFLKQRAGAADTQWPAATDVTIAASAATPTIDSEVSQSGEFDKATLQPGAEIDRVKLDRCTALVVAHASLEPRYRRGETILVEPVENGFRYGDDLVIELAEKGKFEVGRLLIEGRDELVIELPRGGSLSIDRRSIRSTRRIAFVAR
jgi:hypothetical protein